MASRRLNSVDNILKTLKTPEDLLKAPYRLRNVARRLFKVPKILKDT